MAAEVNILFEAREIVRTQPMNLRVAHLKKVADDLHEAYDVLKVSCSRAAATNFIAQFNRTLLAIEMIHESTPPTSTGGRMALPQEREQVGAPAAS